MHFPTELLSHDQYKQQASMLKLASRLDLKSCNTGKFKKKERKKEVLQCVSDSIKLQ